MKHALKIALAALAISLCAAVVPAWADKLPSRDRSVVMLHVIADKGMECSLLDKWEAMVIKIQSRQERRDWDRDRRKRAANAIAADMAEKTCEDGMVTGWIDAARPNLSAEGLAPFLVVYQQMAKRDRPPETFDATTLRLDYSDALARIDAEFERLEADGRVAEGGKSWDEYRAGLKVFLDEALDAMETGEEAQSRKAREAQIYIAVAASIVETWLEETGGTTAE